MNGRMFYIELHPKESFAYVERLMIPDLRKM